MIDKNYEAFKKLKTEKAYNMHAYYLCPYKCWQNDSPIIAGRCGEHCYIYQQRMNSMDGAGI